MFNFHIDSAQRFNFHIGTTPSAPVDKDERAQKAAAANDLLQKLAKATNNGDMTDVDPNKFLDEMGGLSDAEKQFLAEMEPQMDEALRAFNKEPKAPPPRPDAPEVKKGFLLEQMEKTVFILTSS